ncbi:MAG TPA: DUF3307 domain-containing protein [Verrucomicrobiales bacterium]|jgi:hypothetical protein|nr:DUF3307 domain-containing protein [Verrucomicrobiales bacterium]
MSLLAIITTEPHSVQGIFLIFFALAIGHAVMDFPLQGKFLSKAKDRHADTSSFMGTDPPAGVWIHALTAHSLIHAGAVWIITGSSALAAIELALHWLIDYAKCEGWTGFHTDQILHYTCKLIYAMMIYLGVSWI